MSTKLDLLLIRSGITYRQLDHWTRKGWIEPRYRRRNGELTDEIKSGYVRDYTEQEQRVILRMGRLTNIGLKAEQAAAAARSMVDRDEDWVRLDGGVTVTVDLAGIEGWNRPAEQRLEVVEENGGQDCTCTSFSYLEAIECPMHGRHEDDGSIGPPLDWEKGEID